MTDTVVSSASREVVIGFERPFVVIGERINPTGRKMLAAEMAAGNFSRVERDAVAQVAAEVRRLTSQAEAMLWFGLAENGRIEEFSKALERLDRADELLEAAQLPEPDRIGLTRQIEVLREDLTLSLARSRKSAAWPGFSARAMSKCSMALRKRPSYNHE